MIFKTFPVFRYTFAYVCFIIYIRSYTFYRLSLTCRAQNDSNFTCVMTQVTDMLPLPALRSWLSYSVAESYKMSALNKDMGEQASTCKNAEELVDERGKTNTLVWKLFGFLGSDKLIVSLLCKMCRKVPTNIANTSNLFRLTEHTESHKQ